MNSSYIISKVNDIPFPAQHIILEFLDYKLRRGRYIKQLTKERISFIQNAFDERTGAEYNQEFKEVDVC